MQQRREGGSIPIENRRRLVWLALWVTFLFCLLIIQFYRIQIIDGDKWTKKALAQHHLTLVEPCKRGTFYANTSVKKGHPEVLRPLVVDVPKFHLFVDPKSIPSHLKPSIVSAISSILHCKKEDSKKITGHLSKESRNRKVLMWLSRDKRNAIDLWWMDFAKAHKIPRNAIYFLQDYKRSYPFGKLLGQILHTVREDKDPITHQHIPTGGLELVFDRYLQGKEGKRILLRSPKHSLDTGRLIAAPENGSDIILTINDYIQAIAEEEIAKAVKKANAKSGWAIMMDPRTGEIFAWAQYPFFDPSQYKGYFNDIRLSEYTKVQAITDPYEPGSTMKPITMAICLQANEELRKQGKPPIFNPKEKIATANGYFPGRSTPIRDTKLHHFLNMDMAIQKSSNIYMARMVQRVIDALGNAWYRNALQNIFGYGIKTGIELSSESSGLLPTPGKKHPNGSLEWSVPTPFSLSFGHNLLVSSLQMLRSYAILCNGGFDVQPTLIKQIIRTQPDGSYKVIEDHVSPEKVQGYQRLLEQSISDEIVRVMKYITKPGGSAPKADIYGYTEGGKTSTSEKIVNGVYSRTNHISTFIGFAPVKNPRFVMLIAIDEPEHKFIPGIGKNYMGGACAAPVFAEIGARTLQYLGVEPDDPCGYAPGDPRRDAEKADWVKEAAILQKTYLDWNH
ncbi:MAG: penicillin-binding protein 2 [Chlamydiae bacterium]|nr:penicillin-binding protein 2 [Chlamydiota bacterium]